MSFTIDFYWSLDFGEFGFSECPHKKYYLEIKTVDQSRTPVVGAFVEVNGETHTTDSNGVVVVEVPAKFLSIYAHKDGVGSDTRENFNIEYDKKSITMVLSSQGNFKFNQGLSGNNFDIPSATKGNWAYVTVQKCTTAAIDKQGNLYMWGLNNDGQIGDGTKTDCLKPKKIMSNVDYVITDDYTTAAIDKQGDLYMWGYNSSGQVGDGTKTSCLKPKKIMSNVDYVSFDGSTTAAIDKQGNLYMWGYNGNGQVGDGTRTIYHKPKKIMSNVEYVNIEHETTAAIDKQGNLYMWGDNYHGQIGDGTTTDCLKPKKILSNVDYVGSDGYTTAAIDKQGNLYMWGCNKYGQIGDGTSGWDNYCLKPKKIMSNVRYVSSDGNTTAAIDRQGDLYKWGYNELGAIGDGTYGELNYCLKPKKIMSNVEYVNIENGSTAAIDKQGNLYMWGENWYGKIGDGTYDLCPKPKKIMTNVDYVNWGYFTTTAIDKQGNLYMWGDNKFGQIGDGTTENRYTPTLIPCPTDTSTILKTKAQPIATVNAISENTKTKQFSSLIPNCTYNFYVVQTRDTKDILSDDNLLYISQATADENGKLTVTYDTAKEFEREECFVIQAQQTDIANAEIKIDSITANGTEQSIEPIVTVDGETLMNGIDYDLAGDFKVKEPGEYSITVIGVGMYKGEKTIKFNVQEAKSTGDTNNDGEVNIADALMISRYDAGLTELDESQLAVSDVNNDGEVNIADALMISRFDAGLINEL